MTSQPLSLNLTSKIAPFHYGVWRAMRKFLYRHFWLIGGRGSGKSTLAAFRILIGILEDPQANAVVYRQVQTDLRVSVMAQFIWCIYELGLQQYFRVYNSPARIVYIPTGQMILFRGMDDPSKTKSIKVPHGYIKFTWFEEFDQFAGMEAVSTALISTMRGGDVFQNIVTYNPPESSTNWVNAEALKFYPDRYVHKSNYLCMPRNWLGEPFIAEAEAMKHNNERMYNHIYLGDITGTGSEIFSNLKIRRITQQERDNFRMRRYGLDFGFENDPSALMLCAYDHSHKTIYIYGEWVKHGQFEEGIFDAIKRFGIENNVIIADSAESRAIARLQSLGARRMTKCFKRANFPEEGLVWMRSRTQIVIDPVDCPHAVDEFTHYEYEELKDGTKRNEYPDRNNHTIDAVRYALENDIRYGDAPRQF